MREPGGNCRRETVLPTTEIDTLDAGTEMKGVDRKESIQVYAILSRVSFWGVPFTQYHILFSLCRQAPFKKGNSQTDSSVQENPAAPSPCQYG
jgi:hypothetical protein